MAVYKLYTDKPTDFECKIQLEGASVKNAEARLVVEAPDKTLLFKGSISSSGKCSIPINRLRNLFDDQTRGQLKLEIIVDDTYFQPWSKPFVVTASKKLRVEVNEPTQGKKNKIMVDVVDPETKKEQVITESIVKKLRKKKITAEKLSSPNVKRYISSLIKEYIRRTDYDGDAHKLISKIINELI